MGCLTESLQFRLPERKRLAADSEEYSVSLRSTMLAGH